MKQRKPTMVERVAALDQSQQNTPADSKPPLQSCEAMSAASSPLRPDTETIRVSRQAADWPRPARKAIARPIAPLGGRQQRCWLSWMMVPKSREKRSACGKIERFSAGKRVRS